MRLILAILFLVAIAATAEAAPRRGGCPGGVCQVAASPQFAQPSSPAGVTLLPVALGIRQAYQPVDPATAQAVCTATTCTVSQQAMQPQGWRRGGRRGR